MEPPRNPAMPETTLCPQSNFLNCGAAAEPNHARNHALPAVQFPNLKWTCLPGTQFPNLKMEPPRNPAMPETTLCPQSNFLN